MSDLLAGPGLQRGERWGLEMSPIHLLVTSEANDWFVAEAAERHGPYKRYEALAVAASKAMRAVENGATAEVLLEHPDGRRTTLLKHQPQTSRGLAD